MGGGVVGDKDNDAKSGGACGTGLIKSYLTVYNVFLLVGSGLITALGIWSINAEVWLVGGLGELWFPLPGYLLLGGGLVGLVAGCSGCCGLPRSDRCFLLIYILLLLLLFLLQVVAGGAALLYRDAAPSSLGARLNGTLMEDYGLDEVTTGGVDQLQQKFGCCGAASYADWRHSAWKRHTPNAVPDSCCKSPGPGCGGRDHPSNIFYTGCVHALSSEVRGRLGYVAVGGLGLCLLQLFGVVLSASLYIRLKDEETLDPVQL